MRTSIATVFVLTFLSLSMTSSADHHGGYYADLVFDVSNTGSVSISGISNYPSFSEGAYDIYTAKNGVYWVLNISSEDIFSDYVYTVMMPPGSSINYIKASGNINIKHSERIMIEGVGGHEEFFIIIQYRINPPDYSGYWWSLIIPFLFAVLIIVRYRFRGKGPGKARYNPEMLSERQLAIARALEKNGKPMTQRQLEEALGLPKASVSRNVATLVKEGVLTKHSRGISNAIWFYENQNQ